MSVVDSFMSQQYPLWALTLDDLLHLVRMCGTEEEVRTELVIAEMVLGPQPVVGWLPPEEVLNDPKAFLGHNGFTDRVTVFGADREQVVEMTVARWRSEKARQTDQGGGSGQARLAGPGGQLPPARQ